MKRILFSLVMVCMTVFLATLIIGCGAGSAGTGGTTAAPTPVFTLSSTNFNSGEAIPTTHALSDCGGTNRSIQLSWTNAPSGIKSFAVSMLDKSSSPVNFVHWLVTDISSTETSIAAGVSGTNIMPDNMPTGSREYTDNYPSNLPGYGGPCPPTGETHTYEVTLYALSESSTTFVNSTTGGNLTAFNNALSGKILGQASITGTFRKP
jgi:Raf kinase inhibitor-like YbhB/YbcL family protein